MSICSTKSWGQVCGVCYWGMGTSLWARIEGQRQFHIIRVTLSCLLVELPDLRAQLIYCGCFILILGTPTYSWISLPSVSEKRPSVGRYSQDPKGSVLQRRYRMPLSNSSTVNIMLPPIELPWGVHRSWVFGASGLLKMFTTMVRILDFGARLSGFKSWFSYFPSLLLSISSCKTVNHRGKLHRIVVRIKWVNILKVISIMRSKCIIDTILKVLFPPLF